MRARRSLVIFCAAVAFVLSGRIVASDTILIHGHIYTGSPKAPWVQALAVSGSRIEAVGTDQEILSHKQPQTKVIDLQGRTVIPGISDSHVHMWFGGLELHGLSLSSPEGTITPDEPEKFVLDDGPTRGGAILLELDGRLRIGRPIR